MRTNSGCGFYNSRVRVDIQLLAKIYIVVSGARTYKLYNIR
jgi:hypothetical protein